MKEKALYFYRHGSNCSQCILKAAEVVYQIPLSKNTLSMCSGVNTGFGIGGMCSVLIAGIMVFGLLFNDMDTKRMRIKFLNLFADSYTSMNCYELKRERKNGCKCETLIGDIAELIERVISEA